MVLQALHLMVRSGQIHVSHEWDHNRCSQCSQEEETTVHMIKCNHLETAKETWKEAQMRLKEHLTKQGTCPLL